MSALEHPGIRTYLHLDRRAQIGPFSAALRSMHLDPVLIDRRPTRWAGPELVDVSLDALCRALADGCDYFLLVSGQDFPLRPAEDLVAFCAEAGGRSYMRSWRLPYKGWRFDGRDRTDFYTYTVRDRRETCVPRGEDTSLLSRKGRALNTALRIRSAARPARRFPPYAKPHGGMQWWNLSRPAAEHVLRFVDEHPDYRRYHEHTLAPDEIFFQSILAGTEFAERHEIIDDVLRFMVWPEGDRHPRVLTTDDLPAITGSHDLFARKFDTDVDAAVIDALEATLRPGSS